MTPLQWEMQMIKLGRAKRIIEQLSTVSDLLYNLSRSVISLSAIGVSYGHNRAEKKEWEKGRDEALFPDAIGDLFAANATIVFPNQNDDAAPRAELAND